MLAATDKTLTWRGHQTVDEVLAGLAPPRVIEIILPASYDHALFSHLKPNAPPGQLEHLDLEGDLAILHIVSRIKGLEDFRSLIGPLSRLNAKVKVCSPPRVFIILE